MGQLDTVATLLPLWDEVVEDVLQKCVEQQGAEGVALFHAPFNVELFAHLVGLDCGGLVGIQRLE